MKIELKLITSRKETINGYPLVIEVAHQNKRKSKNICFCKINHFIKDGKTISEKHPDYDIIAPIIMDLKLRARKIVLNGVDNVDQAFSELFSVNTDQILFLDFANKLISDMKEIALQLGKSNELIAQNKQLGNIRVYENVVAQFENFGRNIPLASLSYDVLMQFRNYQTGIGNAKGTVHLYLRTLRAIYNKGIAIYKLENTNPFKGVFDNLKQRAFSNKKKYLDKDLLYKLEKLNLKSEKQKYIDLFLLQFYFGGCDLVDLYYLKNNQFRRGRLSFVRTKTNTDIRIDLKIHPKAEILLNKYKTPGDWLFPWKKDKDSYENFRRTYQRGLIYVQERNDIEVLPDGGNLGVKVARHTFANIAKGLMIDPDIIRELMGHERDDVDNYYKDKYSELIRDNALFEIISWFNCVK